MNPHSVTAHALDIFIQHYYPIDWLQTNQLIQLFTTTRQEIRTARKRFHSRHYMNFLDLIAITLRHGIVATTLHYIYQNCCRSANVYDDEFWATKLQSYYLEKAKVALSFNHGEAAKYWQAFAKGLNITHKQEIVLTRPAVPFYIMAELEEAKAASPIRDRDVKLWSSKLEEWQLFSRSNGWINRNIKSHLAVAWQEILFESMMSRKEDWKKYGERKSREAKLAGDERSSEEWKRVAPWIWNICEDDRFYESSERAVLLSLVATLIMKRDSYALSRPLLQAISTAFQDLAPERSTITDLITNDDEWDDMRDGEVYDPNYIFSQHNDEEAREFYEVSSRPISKLQQLRILMYYLLSFSLMLIKYQDLHRAINIKLGLYAKELFQHSELEVFKNFQQLTKKAEHCLSHYLTRLDPQYILVPTNLMLISESWKMHQSLFSNLSSTFGGTHFVLNHRRSLWIAVNGGHVYVTRFLLEEDQLLKEANKFISCLDQKMTEYLSKQDCRVLDLTPTLDQNREYVDNILELREPIRSLAYSVEWIAQFPEPNILMTLEQYCLWITESFMVNNSPDKPRFGVNIIVEVLDLILHTALWKQ